MLDMLASTTVVVPALVPTAAAVAVVLTAFGLLWRFVVSPLVKGVRYVGDRVEELSSLVEQVRDLVSYVGRSGADIEARFLRIEQNAGLMPWAGVPVRPPPLRTELEERTTTRRVTEEHP